MQPSIPQFIQKLYHILQNQQYKSFICWNNDNQFVIKNTKKLQEKVLPTYFRHKKISSFIRQLNLYQFKKIDRSSTQKSKSMYFHNPFFIRGEKTQLQKIKRNNNKKKSIKEQHKEIQRAIESDDNQVSFVQDIQQNPQLFNYKRETINYFTEIKENLLKILKIYPQTRQFQMAMNFCSQFTSISQQYDNQINYDNDFVFSPLEQIQEEKNQKLSNKILPSTSSKSQKLLPLIDTYQSRPNLNNFFTYNNQQIKFDFVGKSIKNIQIIPRQQMPDTYY